MSFENTQSRKSRLMLSKLFASAIVTLSLASAPLTSWSQSTDATVKMSQNGVCHDASSRHYERVKNFKPYPSLEACLDDGGRAPKK